MRTRSRARGWTLQALYAWDSQGRSKSLADAFAEFAADRGIGETSRAYVHELIRAIDAHGVEIDAALDAALTNWRLERLSVVDRNILRIGAAEILFIEDVPPRVSIQEGIALAEKYGTRESPRFVNGVLDAVMRQAGAEQGREAR